VTDKIIREEIAALLRKTKGTVDPAKLLSAKTRRMDYEGARPVSCSAASGAASQEVPE
jgi:hypothetical protein